MSADRLKKGCVAGKVVLKKFINLTYQMHLLKQTLANPWLRRFILVGYAAKGSLYFLIGILAIQAALVANEAAGTYVALVTLGRQPLGKLFLCLLAVGLMGYVLRRFIQAALDPGHSNSLKPKRILHRLGYIISGISYAGVAYSAFNITLELGEQDNPIEDLVEELFEQQLGGWLILLGGIAVFSVGLSYLYGAYTGSYISEFRSSGIQPRFEWWAIAVGKTGVAARGVAFVLTGIFLIQAALWADSNLAGGLQNALRTIEAQPFGWLWLGLVGLGFIAYGLYMFVSVGYRRFILR
jgi:Domain of Unknown Function (DUF1206)